MEEWNIGRKEEGRRLDAFLMERKGWSRSFFMKALRTKKIKVNGKKMEPSYRLMEGDAVRSFVLEIKKSRPVDILYEDENLLAVNKPAGLLSLDVTGRTEDTMLDRVNSLLAERGEKTAYPVHRIDFNTSGILLLAKNGRAGEILDRMIKERKIRKSYLCVVKGRPSPDKGRLENQLFKDAKKNRVYVAEHTVKGSKTAITDYRVIVSRNGLSLVECHLLTGRTHQIRCQMAHAGHPLLGDDKYGSKEWNREKGERRQLLSSYKTTFDFGEEGSLLSYLSGKTIKLPKVSFVEKYFKGIGI
ncbi:RluA family pseudouridine synthase [uncultured Dialister sp.]|jgi:23S rRNA pseudouridine955/2504/2580 synthase|uniref:RluA family pseudouridine synthase n=1 Tax=uncultured Dialister sp. TaxID=278064 RepID=UPI00267615BF|nr:RluA family pseudouridine synthase [uncultured Dialister sp.]